MKSKFKINDFTPPPPPKMKKKNRFTIKELLQKKKKTEKNRNIAKYKKKRGFTTAELSPQPIMRKKIKNKIIDTRSSPPKPSRSSPTKPSRSSPPKPPRLTNIKFTIEDVPSPPKPKPPRLTNIKFTIEDVPSPPKQQRNSSIPSMSASASPSSSPTLCCSCNNTRSVQTSAKCAWCKLYYHLEKCVSQNAKERNKRN